MTGARPGCKPGSGVRVACCEIAPEVGDAEGNRRRAREAVREAVDAGARLVVLPELSTSGYVFESEEEARALAQAADGGALRDWGEEAARGDAVVVGGFAEAGDDGLLYNSAAVVDATGPVAVYRKLHLWDREKLVFEPGSEPAPVVETRVGRVGVAVPGRERGVDWVGGSVVCDENGWALAGPRRLGPGSSSPTASSSARATRPGAKGTTSSATAAPRSTRSGTRPQSPESAGPRAFLRGSPPRASGA